MTAFSRVTLSSVVALVALLAVTWEGAGAQGSVSPLDALFCQDARFVSQVARTLRRLWRAPSETPASTITPRTPL